MAPLRLGLAIPPGGHRGGSPARPRSLRPCHAAGWHLGSCYPTRPVFGVGRGAASSPGGLP
eukprot:156495-Alexandrium_andersonii.AAC.1